ncbi:hypothetical protein AKJ16_DCAP08125 [Drosera capensis]
MARSTTLKLICMAFIVVILLAPHAEATFDYDAPNPITALFTVIATSFCYQYLKTGRGEGLLFFKPFCCLGLEAVKELAYSSDASLTDTCVVLQNLEDFFDILDKYSISIIKFCNITTDYVITRSIDCKTLSLS